MQYYGNDVTAIRGVWRAGTNLGKVNELTAQGVPLSDAVMQAWTVTRAQKLGFTKVTVVLQEGTPGNYTKIDVLIEK